jgi:hypothetical protein
MTKMKNAAHLVANILVVFFLTGCVAGMNTSGNTHRSRSIHVTLSEDAPQYEVQIEKECVNRVSNWRQDHGLSPIKITTRRAVKNGKIVKKLFENTVIHTLGVLTATVSTPILAVGGMFFGDTGRRNSEDTRNAIAQLKQCKRELMFEWQREHSVTSAY